MRELVRTTDPVLISWLEATLRAEGIEPLVLDQHMSVLEGSVALLPRRVMVAGEDYTAARSILSRAPAYSDDA